MTCSQAELVAPVAVMAPECADAPPCLDALGLVLCWLRVGARVVLPCPYAVHAAHVFSRGVCSWRGRHGVHAARTKITLFRLIAGGGVTGDDWIMVLVMTPALA